MKNLMKTMLSLLVFSGTAAAQGDDPYMVVQEGTLNEWTAEEAPQVTGWLSEYDPSTPNYEAVPEFNKKNVPSQTMWAYPDIREADVAWMTRYERIIDTRQKMNMVLRYPKLSLTDLLLKSALSESVIPYRDREFKEPLDVIQLKELLTTRIIVDVPDSIDNTIINQVLINESLDKSKIVKFRVMEDWIFDKKHSRMICRIVAIAPIYKPLVANGQVELPEQPLCWFRYDDMRAIFVNAEVFNRNMAARISMDHFFQARMFDSYIVKEPNVYDYDIKDFPEYEDNGLAALLKSEDVKNDLFVMEHDLWEY